MNRLLPLFPIILCLQIFPAFREDDVVGRMQGFGHLNGYCLPHAPLAQSFMRHWLFVQLSTNELVNLQGLGARRFAGWANRAQIIDFSF